MSLSSACISSNAFHNSKELNNSFTQKASNASHVYRTEIPNTVLLSLNLDPYEGWVYTHIKQMAGDRGVCHMSNKNLADRIGISEKKIRLVKKTLASPRPELGGRSLISIETRISPEGTRSTDMVTVNDIWDINYSHYEARKMQRCTAQTQNQKTISAVQHTGGGAVPGTDKEEPILKKNSCCNARDAREGVHPPPIPESMENSEQPLGSIKLAKGGYLEKAMLHRWAVGRSYEIEEIEYSWECVKSFTSPIWDWVRFVEGCIDRHRTRKQSFKPRDRSQQKSSARTVKATPVGYVQPPARKPPEPIIHRGVLCYNPSAWKFFESTFRFQHGRQCTDLEFQEQYQEPIEFKIRYEKYKESISNDTANNQQ